MLLPKKLVQTPTTGCSTKLKIEQAALTLRAVLSQYFEIRVLGFHIERNYLHTIKYLDHPAGFV